MYTRPALFLGLLAVVAEALAYLPANEGNHPRHMDNLQTARMLKRRNLTASLSVNETIPCKREPDSVVSFNEESNFKIVGATSNLTIVANGRGRQPLAIEGSSSNRMPVSGNSFASSSTLSSTTAGPSVSVVAASASTGNGMKVVQSWTGDDVSLFCIGIIRHVLTFSSRTSSKVGISSRTQIQPMET